MTKYEGRMEEWLTQGHEVQVSPRSVRKLRQIFGSQIFLLWGST